MRFAVSAMFGEARMTARGEYLEEPPEGVHRWRVDQGHFVAADPHYSVLLDGLAADSLDGIRDQAAARLRSLIQAVTQSTKAEAEEYAERISAITGRKVDLR